MNRFPPLHALHCFESVSRHLSVKDAAAEMHVTSAAISQQLAKLEDALGIALFDKSQRGMVLTEQGQRYFLGIRTAFRQIEESTRRLQASSAPPVVTVSCSPTFAMMWLLPRLPQFQAEHPTIDVRLSTTAQLVDFARDDVDFGIRHGLGRYPGLEVDKLLHENLQPVCSPTLLGRRKQMKSPDELRNFTLLHDEHNEDWQLWLEAAGATQVDWRKGQVFVASNGAIFAALEGHGVALARKSLVAREIERGRLVMPFKTSLATAFAYYLVYPAETRLRDEAASFRDWILRETKASR
jgi:LysR family glycine cleavage system transcriptional activator